MCNAKTVSKESEELIKKLYTYNPETGYITKLDDNNEVAYTSNLGYKVIYVHNRVLQASRVAWFLYYNEWPQQVIDHIDGDPLNNKINNLRSVTQQQNLMNRRMFKNNKSGVTGVAKLDNGTYRVRITVDGHKYCLGSFKDFFEACCARKSYENTREFGPNHTK